MQPECHLQPDDHGKIYNPMNWVRKLILIGFILRSATGCTAVDALAIAILVEDFAKGVMLLSQVIKSDFSLAENVNTRAFRSNLKLQLETEGDLDVVQRPLYSSADLAVRAALLGKLTHYAQSLSDVASGDDPKPYFASRLRDAVPIDLDRLDLEHSLDQAGILDLQKGLQYFKQFFELPEREAKLEKVFTSGSSAIEKTAKMLYLDLGAKADYVRACNFAPPKTNSLQRIHNLILCRGGLRGMLKSVLEKEVSIWKKRLSLVKRSKTIPPELEDQHLIGKIALTQKSGKQVDQIIVQTQAALRMMISSHDQIVHMLKHPGNVRSASDLFATQAFLDGVTVLAERTKWIARSIDGQSLQPSASIDDLNSITKENKK